MESGVEIYRGFLGAVLVERLARAAWLVITEAISTGSEWWHPNYAFVSAYGQHPDLLSLIPELPVPDGHEVYSLSTPQTLAMLPSVAGVPYEPHVDTVTRVGEKVLATVVGVPLSPSGDRDGCFRYWPDGTNGDVVLVPSEPGDVIVMSADTLHGAGPNLSTVPRVAVYYRFAADPASLPWMREQAAA